MGKLIIDIINKHAEKYFNFFLYPIETRPIKYIEINRPGIVTNESSISFITWYYIKSLFFQIKYKEKSELLTYIFI